MCAVPFVTRLPVSAHFHTLTECRVYVEVCVQPITFNDGGQRQYLQVKSRSRDWQRELWGFCSCTCCFVVFGLPISFCIFNTGLTLQLNQLLPNRNRSSPPTHPDRHPSVNAIATKRCLVRPPETTVILNWMGNCDQVTLVPLGIQTICKQCLYSPRGSTEWAGTIVCTLTKSLHRLKGHLSQRTQELSFMPNSSCSWWELLFFQLTRTEWDIMC